IPAPQGPDTGAVLVSKTGSPRRSHEPLTGRQSLIVAEARIELPSSGTYYGAVFDAQGREGKLWVALGQQEGLAWANLARLPSWIRQARTFHDVPGWPYWMGIFGAGALAVVALVATRVMRHTRS